MSTKAQSIQFLLSQVRTSTSVLAGGKAYFYAAGTDELKDVWLDRGKITQAANPYTLDANATAQLYGDGLYRIVIKNTNGSVKPALWTTVYDRDDLKFAELTGETFANVLDYGAGTLAEAVAAIGSTPTTLIYGTDQTLSANIVIPQTLELMPINGAVIHHSAYTISAPAGQSINTARWPQAQIFNGTGAVTELGEALPEYFATNTSPGATDMTAAFNKAFLASKRVTYGPAPHKITSKLTIPAGVEFVGVGNPQIIATFADPDNVIALGVGSTMSNMTIIGGNRVTAASSVGVAQGYNYDANVKGVTMEQNSTCRGVTFAGTFTGYEGGASGITLDDCNATQTGNAAVSFYHASNVNIRGGHYWQCGGTGGVILYSCTGFTITGVHVYNPTTTGIDLGGSSTAGYNTLKGTVTNCVVEAGDCINFEQGAIDCSVTGNTVTINSELGVGNGTGIAFKSSQTGGGPVSNNTISGNTVTSKTGGQGIVFGSLLTGQYVDRMNVIGNTVSGVNLGIYVIGGAGNIAKACKISGNTVAAGTWGLAINHLADKLDVTDNTLSTASAVTISSYCGIEIYIAISNSRIQGNTTTGWGTHYKQNAICPNTVINDYRAFANETDGAAFTVFYSGVSPSITPRAFLATFAANGVSGSYSFTPTAATGLLVLDANVSGVSASNQSSSLWLYMNTTAGASSGYSDTGISIVKIAGLKHDFAGAIADCALVGSAVSDVITISAGGFDTFSIREIPLVQ